MIPVISVLKINLFPYSALLIHKEDPTMKKKLSLFLILAMLAALCIPLEPSGSSGVCRTIPFFSMQAEAASIRLSGSSIVVPVGMRGQLSVSGTSKSVTWSSSDTSIAAVTSSGTVTGKKTGSAIITAKISGQSLKCKVLVINRYNVRHVGNAVLTIVRRYYKSAFLLESERTGNTTTVVIAKPQGDGAPGMDISVNITTGKATCDPDWDTFFPAVPRTFYVWKCSKIVKVSRLTMNRTAATVIKGKTVTLKATASPSTATNKAVSWKSSNTQIATVTSKGVVKGIKAGTATIYATARDGSGKKASCRVTVKNASSASTVFNITGNVLVMKMADAAKLLRFSYYRIYGQRDNTAGYFKANVKPSRTNTNHVSCFRKDEQKRGFWDLTISDRTLALYGVKVGMTKKQAHDLLTKNKWKKISDKPDEVLYSSTNTRSLMYKNKGIVRIWFDEETKRIYEICYLVHYLD